MSWLHSRTSKVRRLGGTTVVATVGMALTLGGVGAAGAAPEATSAPAAGQVAGGYTLELLEPTNDGVAASALGINDAGDVVGITRPETTAQPQLTVLWERHGDHFHVHELGNLEGSQFSRGFDLSADRTIVGEAFDSGGDSIPIRWTDEEPEHVQLDEAGSGILHDIDEAGFAVGTASGEAVRLDADEVTVLPAPAHADEGATVNSYTATAVDGDVIGGRTSIAVPHGDHSHNELFGVVWEGDEPRLLQDLAGASTPTVTDVTAAGEAVGTVMVGSTETAVTWDEAGVASALPAPSVGTYTHTAANAASDDVVVGYVSQFAGNPSFGAAAIAWGEDGPVDLNTLVAELPEDITLQAANDVNAAGQIVGNAVLQTEDGDQARGFVLTPVESPDPGQVLDLAPLAHHYHQGSPINATVTVTPEPGEDDTLEWQWSWPGVEGWAPIPSAEGTTWSSIAEQALHEVRIRVVLTPADPEREPIVSQVRTIDVDDHGAPATQQVTVTGETSYAVGDQVTLSAAVDPATVLETFQWQRKAAGGEEFETLAGETGAVLSFTATAADGHADYRAAVVTPDGEVVYGPSDPVRLHVGDHGPVDPTPTPTPPPATGNKKKPVAIKIAGITRTTKAGRPVVRAGAKGKRGQIRLRITGQEITRYGKVKVRIKGVKGQLTAKVTQRGALVVKVPKRVKPGKRLLVIRYQGNAQTRKATQRLVIRVR